MGLTWSTYRYQILRQQVEQLLRYNDLTVIKMAAVHYLGFLGIQIFNCRYRVNMYHSVIFRADRPSLCRDMAVL